MHHIVYTQKIYKKTRHTNTRDIVSSSLFLFLLLFHHSIKLYPFTIGFSKKKRPLLLLLLLQLIHPLCVSLVKQINKGNTKRTHCIFLNRSTQTLVWILIEQSTREQTREAPNAPRNGVAPHTQNCNQRASASTHEGNQEEEKKNKVYISWTENK